MQGQAISGGRSAGLGTRGTLVASTCADIVSLQRKTSVGSSWPQHTSETSHQPLPKTTVLATTSLDCVGFANTERRHFSVNSYHPMHPMQQRILCHRKTYQHRSHATTWQIGLVTDVRVRKRLFTLAFDVFHTAELSGISKERGSPERRRATRTT
jgi:hypothetical protein